MIKQSGVVDAVAGTQISVHTEKTIGCDHCSNKDGCGYSLLGAFSPKRVLIIDSEQVLEPGNKVCIALDEKNFLWASALAYLFPILSLCLGAIVGDAIGAKLNLENVELVSIIFALSGFLMSIFIRQWIEISCLPAKYFQPTIFRDNN